MRRGWFHWEPETEERMSHLGGRFTPCEMLRQIYKKVEDPEVKVMLRIATTMCKSLSDRICEFEGNHRWGATVYPLNPLWKFQMRQNKLKNSSPSQQE